MWKTAFEKFKRLSFTNFTWFLLEYFLSYLCCKAQKHYFKKKYVDKVWEVGCHGNEPNFIKKSFVFKTRML